MSRSGVATDDIAAAAAFLAFDGAASVTGHGQDRRVDGGPVGSVPAWGPGARHVAGPAVSDGGPAWLPPPAKAPARAASTAVCAASAGSAGSGAVWSSTVW